MSHGITSGDHSLFLKLRREGRVFSAWYSRDGRRWAALTSCDAGFDERVDVGVVAVNSSGRVLSAELERLRIEDPQGSMARDFAGDDSGRLATPPPTSEAIGRAPAESP
jgi:regulation of enolase protein 1 (concanavalin A-like superfamily)